MVNGQLKNYIQEGLKSGKTRDEIEKSLLEIGWREVDIQEAFASAKMPEVPVSTQEKKEAKIVRLQNKTSPIRFLKFIIKRPRIYYMLGAILLIAGAIFLYQKIILKEELSEFELTPKIADAAGIVPTTTFTLKSSADLSATVVQKYLQFEPQIEYKIRKISSGSSVFEIIPEVALNENEIYSVKIAEGPIAARVYSWAYQVKALFQVVASLPRDKSSDVPTNTGIEITFNRENIINPEQFFEISPAVSGRFEIHRNILVFIPSHELNPKTVYTIKIKTGIKAQGSDDTLSKDAEIRFETGEKYTYQLRPYFNFGKTFWEFKPDIEVAFAINYSNLSVNTVPLTVYRFGSMQEFMSAYKGALSEENKWTRYHAYNPVIPSANKKIFESSMPLEEQTHVKFIRMPQKLGEGFYLADVVVNNEHEQAWFQVTPVAGFSAISGSKTILWLKDLNNGNNLSNAEVAFEGNNIERTNSDGVAMFDTPPQLIRSNGESDYYHYYSPLSYFYTVSAGGRQLAIPIENKYGYFSKLSPADAWWDYFSIDKGVYLPNDKIHFWGIVKQRNGTDIKGEEVTIQLTNLFWAGTPKDDIIIYGETKSQISDFYTLTGEINFSDLKPGPYQLSVKRGDEVIVSENVNIETYIKPAYKIILAPDKNAVFAGDAIAYKIKAEFFDGTPVANLRLKYNGYLDNEIKGEVELNQEGEGSFAVKTEYQENQYNYWPRYLDMNISPAVSEEGEISSSISVLVFGPRIDLTSEQSFSDKTSKFDLKLKKIVLDKVQSGEPWWDSDNYLGDPAPGWSITADVDEIIYKQTEIRKEYDIINKVIYPIYSYSTEYKPVRQDTLITDESGSVHYEWTPEEKKSYRITFTTKDAERRLIKIDRYAYGGSLSYFSFYDAGGVALKNLNDKNEYRLGEQVRLQMQDKTGNALATESGKFIFMRVNNGVISYQIADSPDYIDNFKDAYVPNIDIVGVWFSGSHFIDSYPVGLSFDSDERRLNIEVKKDKERYRPRDKVNLSIKVTDKNGSPKQAEVNVSGIDEAVFSLNPTEKDIADEFYQDIFSSLITRSSHVTPLEGEGLGGGGGGGEERLNFRDVVIYKTIRTNSNGYAEVSFDVPDNLTSWRLTTQAITRDLFAGKAVNFAPVGLPFFVETALNRTYLAGDNLNLRARVFGTANIQDNITYTIESETLQFKKIERTGGKIIEISLGNLTPGKHRIKISAKAGGYSDAIIRDLNVLTSYFSQNTSEFYELSPNLSSIQGATKGYTTLLITSYERGRFYNVLQWLNCECGARIDQKFTSWLAKTYLNRFFGEKNEAEDVDVRSYQTYDGGITLLPYSDKDLELSAKFAHLIKDESAMTDKESLKRYLTASLIDQKADLSRIATALYGLSAFREPILVTLQNIKSDKNLTLMDKIYVALALDSLGAKEEARNYYRTEIKPTLAAKKPFVFVNKLRSQDDNIIATALLAGLTANLSEPESDGLGQYAIENYPKETLKNFEVFLYLKAVLPKLSSDKVNFSWHTLARSGSETLEKNEVFRLELSQEELSTLRFNNISGRIGLVSNFEKESLPAEVKKDTTISVNRKYSVDGRPTTEFSDEDLVRIDITPTFTPNAFEGAYQIIDYLPSGLRAVTNLQRTPIQPGAHYHLYPSDIEDQKITFVIWKNFPRSFFYYARVVSKGDYKAEPALIQSLKSFESENISNDANVRIR